jgi:hypothetical protein
MSKFKIGETVLVVDSIGERGIVCDVLPVDSLGHIDSSLARTTPVTWDIQVNLNGDYDGELQDAPWFDETEVELVS